MASLSAYKRIVVKIGSALLVDADTGEINTHWLDTVAAEVHALRAQNTSVLIVSSGAIALGRKRLAIQHKRLTLSQKQASAAAGQALLTQAYERALAPRGHVTAQALLTLTDTEDRRRYINAKDTLSTLLSLGAIPIVNENDTVATDEIRYGDNDRLAARVAEMVEADLLILLSDVDGLYDKDPHKNPDAVHKPIVEKITPEIMEMGSGANALRGTGTGGMATKLQAASIATQAGCELAICKGGTDSPIIGLLSRENRSTRFLPQTSRKAAKKHWLAGSLKPKGAVHIDDGAKAALLRGSSLLVAGVSKVIGAFQKGDLIDIIDRDSKILARGLTGYNAIDTQQIMGRQSGDIEEALGYSNGPVLIHRNNMATLV